VKIRNRQINVLHVDDEPGLAEVTGELLERADDRFSVDAVTTPAEGLERVETGDYEAVISDFDMGNMDGIEFLERVREDYPDLPFVLYTGKGSETVASEAISAGVTDYLQKESGTEQYELLANRVQNAVERYRSKRSLRRFEKVATHSGHAIYFTDPEGTIEYVNPAFERITGYPAEEAVGRNPRILKSGEMSEAYYENLWETLLGGGVVEEEVINRRHSGELYTANQTIAPITTDEGDIEGFVAVQNDVSDRVKRERILRELHAGTREFYPPESSADITDFLTAFVQNAFAFEAPAFLRFDAEEGALAPAPTAAEAGLMDLESDHIEPGPHPIWEAYEAGTSRLLEDGTLLEGVTAADYPVNQALIVPIGDFGVLLACTVGDDTFEQGDLDLIEVVAKNAETAFERLHSDTRRAELSGERSTLATDVDRLNAVIDATQAVGERLADSATRDAAEAAVCEELVGTDAFDFAWIGRPSGQDADLQPTAWAGSGDRYLDSLDTRDASSPVPAQHAAVDHEPFCVRDIADHVIGEGWAKDALSAGFGTVRSIPLVFDDVLYGVLTVYSTEREPFGSLCGDLLSSVASLLLNTIRTLEARYDSTQDERTELEFEITDSTYPIQRLAAETDARLRYETVTETTSKAVTAMVTVLEGDPQAVMDRASSMTRIVSADWFGEADGHQLSLGIATPCLISVIEAHGGQLAPSVSAPSGTTARIAIDGAVEKRPLLDRLTGRYDDIDLVAQRQRRDATEFDASGALGSLTDRQYEVLAAAYHGGYYETPRQVTGEEIAESFAISNSAIHNHLQAAHGTLADAVVAEGSDFAD
jgi:PAS domain S-box-containing protein